MTVKMNFNPGMQKAGMDPKMVDQLIDVQKIPIKNARTKVEKVEAEKAEYEKIEGLMANLNTSLNGLKTKKYPVRVAFSQKWCKYIVGT